MWQGKRDGWVRDEIFHPVVVMGFNQKIFKTVTQVRTAKWYNLRASTDTFQAYQAISALKLAQFWHVFGEKVVAYALACLQRVFLLKIFDRSYIDFATLNSVCHSACLCCQTRTQASLHRMYTLMCTFSEKFKKAMLLRICKPCCIDSC